MHTPWGPTDYQKTIAPGLIQVSTASHGGYYLSDDRCQEVDRLFGCQPKNFTGRGWLEEDCDWCFAPLTWPELFSPNAVYNAVRTLRVWHTEIPESWFATAHGRKVLAIAEAYESNIRDHWETGGMFGPVEGAPSGSWGVRMRRGDVRQTVVFPEYPRKQFYTDAEVAALPHLAE